MPMLTPVAADLSLEEVSPFHRALLERARSQIRSSREVMAQKYDDWDRFDKVYQGSRLPDKQDIKAAERKEPTKLTVPMTFAQVQTFVAFVFQLFTQRDGVFELTGTGVEDWKAAKIAEALLQRDLMHGNFYCKLYNFLLDIARYGIGVFKHSWVRETQPTWVQTQTAAAPSLFGAPMPPMLTMTLQDLVKFLGNDIRCVSPYRFFPDPRVPLTDFQRGEFVASEEDVTRTWLLRRQADGLFAGIEFIKNIPTELWEQRRFGTATRTTLNWSADQKLSAGFISTEVQCDITPKDFKVNGKLSPLGDSDVPQRWVINMVNDNRVVRAEEMGYLHGNYTYSAAALSPDQQHILNHGIAELCDQLQDVVTWLFNTRITSVRKTIQNQFVVDPEGIEMKDLENRAPVIRLKKGAARSGVERWIKQLDVKDVTAQHLQDALQIGDMIQLVTGVNQNALGQYSSGRRSAEQTKAVNSGAASRLKLFASLIWYQAIDPLGRDMLSNLRDGLDEDQIVRVMGQQVQHPLSPYAVNQNDVSQFLSINKSDLVGNYDFEVLDGTLPTEKSYQASMLEELFGQMLTNPQLVAVFGVDLKAVLTEIAELRGIKNPERFFLQPQQRDMMMQGAQAMGLGTPAGQALAGPAVSAGATAAQAPVQAPPVPGVAPSIAPAPPGLNFQLG